MCGGIGGIFGNGRRRSDQRNFNSRNNQNKRQELKFYPHGTGPDRQMMAFTKVKEHLILKIHVGILNVSDIEESIRKGVI